MKNLFKLLTLTLLCSIFCFGCLSMQTTSVCDAIEGESLLCKIATEQGVPLESVGRGLIVVNAVAITGGLYTKGQAVEVMMALRESLKGSTTYTVFAALLGGYTEKYAELMFVLKIYLEQFNVDSVITDIDRELLITWLDDRIAFLESI